MTPNEGSHPSHLDIDRWITGELNEADTDAFEAGLDTNGRAHVEAVRAARSDVPAFDFTALTERASRVQDSEPPANDNLGFLKWLIPVVVAAVALFLVVPRDAPDVEPGYVGLRGDGSIAAFHLRGGTLGPYDARPLGEGDVVGFRVDGAGHDSVVVLSVDGTGASSVHWPLSGDGQPLREAGVQALPGSLTLDDAPGPEVFVAIFDGEADTALAEADAAWRRGGLDGVTEWARGKENIDFVVVNRK